ncbi:hypothetical protein CDD83_5760 [Cordyceps sp. RAO-2017]|nr:hypothetical protein CDD83_5760 [Cordyceps sp. RAO-2017]
MVQLATLPVAVVAILIPLAAAGNCLPGRNYCGYNLLKKGNYFSQIDSALEGARKPRDSAHIKNALFNCDGGAHGAIAFIKHCSSGCSDGGAGRSDYC